MVLLFVFLLKLIVMFFRLFFKYIVFPGLFFVFVFCQRNNRDADKRIEGVPVAGLNSVKYAQYFGIFKKGSSNVFFIRDNNGDTVFYDIRKPFTRLAVMGTIPSYQMGMLNALDRIIAIDDVKYYCNSKIIERVKKHEIAELMPNLQWNYELLLALEPEVLITYSNLSENLNISQLVQQHNVVHVMYLDYLERHPLARAEWIKLVGLLLGKDTLANRIFDTIEKNYLQLKKHVENVPHKPKVLTEVMYGDVWYIAGNSSYIAQLIRDAGGKYAFDFHEYNDSKPYALEYILKYAQDADYWLHLHQFKTFEQLENANSKYTLFKPYQNKQCFNNNKKQNDYGYSDYYESGICRPDVLLRDLIRVLHPERALSDELVYYYPLKEK